MKFNLGAKVILNKLVGVIEGIFEDKYAVCLEDNSRQIVEEGKLKAIPNFILEEKDFSKLIREGLVISFSDVLPDTYFKAEGKVWKKISDSEAELVKDKSEKKKFDPYELVMLVKKEEIEESYENMSDHDLFKFYEEAKNHENKLLVDRLKTEIKARGLKLPEEKEEKKNESNQNTLIDDEEIKESLITKEVEFNYKGVPYKAKVDFELVVDSNYGADADGNRGMYTEFIEGLDFLSLIDKKTGKEVDLSKLPEGIKDEMLDIISKELLNKNLAERKIVEAEDTPTEWIEYKGKKIKITLQPSKKSWLIQIGNEEDFRPGKGGSLVVGYSHTRIFKDGKYTGERTSKEDLIKLAKHYIDVLDNPEEAKKLYKQAKEKHQTGLASFLKKEAKKKGIKLEEKILEKLESEVWYDKENNMWRGVIKDELGQVESATVAKTKEEVEEWLEDYLKLEEKIDLDPKFLRGIGHKQDNVRLVWWYNLENGDFRATSEKGINHSNEIFKEVAYKPGWIRGRVFEYNNKLFLIIYLNQGKELTEKSLLDLLDKIKTEYNLNIDYIIDAEGRDISNLLEKIDSEIRKKFNFVKFEGINEKRKERSKEEIAQKIKELGKEHHLDVDLYLENLDQYYKLEGYPEISDKELLDDIRDFNRGTYESVFRKKLKEYKFPEEQAGEEKKEKLEFDIPEEEMIGNLKISKEEAKKYHDKKQKGKTNAAVSNVKENKDKLVKLKENYKKDVLRLTENLNQYIDRYQKAVRKLETKSQELEQLLKDHESLNKKLAIAEKVAVERKGKIQVLEKKLDQLTEEYKNKIDEMKKVHTNELLAKYRDTILKVRGLSLPKNILTLLESCKTETEVDEFILRAVDLIRENAIRSNTPNKIQIEEVKSAEQTFLEEKVAKAFRAMGK